MQEKNLTSLERIELIKSMINLTREKYEKNSGSAFLIWGYLSLCVSIIVTLLWSNLQDPNVFWLWWLIPILGYPASMIILRKKEKSVSTYIDRFINYIWIVIGLCCTVAPIILVFSSYSPSLIIPIESLFLSIGVTLTALILSFKPLTILGFISIFISMLMFLLPDYTIYLFMVQFIITMIIPGHILNYKGRCLKS